MSLLPLNRNRKATSRRWMRGAVALLGIALVSSGSTSAAPPPPPEFWDLTITNGSDVPIMDITVELFPTDPAPTTAGVPPYSTFLADTQKFTIPLLSRNRSVMVSTPGLYGISKATATAKTPDGKTVTITITADLGNWDGLAGDEYMGFTRQRPTGEIVPPTLRFTGTEVRAATLSSLERWGLTCPALVTKTLPFN